MPQLVKGGKHAYGWSLVGDTGHITIPPEALDEYRFRESDKLIMVPGSRTSGGFGLGSLEYLKKSILKVMLDLHPALSAFTMAEGKTLVHDGKPCCGIKLRSGGITVPLKTLEEYGIKTGDRLLAIRGSGLAIGFALKGPIVEEAKKHPEMEVFE